MTNRYCKTCGYAVVKDHDAVPFCKLYRRFMPEDDVCHHYEESECMTEYMAKGDRVPNEVLIEYISKKKEQLLNLKKELIDVIGGMC